MSRHCAVFFCACLLATLFFSAPLRAEIQEVAVPGVGAIAFDLPPLTDVRRSGAASDAGGLQYLASAGRISVRIVIGNAWCSSASTHKEVLDCFLAGLAAQKDVVPGSLTSACDDRFCSAMYFGIAELGARFKVYNENVLFLFGGYPVHVQLSTIDPGNKDMDVMRAFSASFAYGK